jgi:hypothetical protein
MSSPVVSSHCSSQLRRMRTGVDFSVIVRPVCECRTHDREGTWAR